MAGDDRTATGEEREQDLEQLTAVDWATVKLVVDANVRRDRRRTVERVEVLGMGVDGAGVFAGGGEVA